LQKFQKWNNFIGFAAQNYIIWAKSDIFEKVLKKPLTTAMRYATMTADSKQGNSNAKSTNSKTTSSGEVLKQAM